MFPLRPKSAAPLGRLMAAICLAALGFGQFCWAVDVPTNCIQHTDVTGTYDQYYALDEIGNQRSEDVPIDFHMFVVVRNFDEEIALMLSHEDRSFQHPDFARTYEIRVGNVYTVIYRETQKMRAYHSPKDKLFPGDKFKLRIRILKEGNITVTIDDNVKKPLLNVYDVNGPTDVRFISFGSRMNEYPITFHFKCDLEMASTEGPMSQALQACPVCPKQKCEVIVKACTDNTKDGNAGDPEKQKYYFYFNMYLSKNKGKGVTAVDNLLK